jgi:hypothetical protein
MTSEIKVNKVSDSCGSALVTKCGSNITIGSSGKNILLACGANQTGFGRSGSVDWCTTAKTSPFSGVSGKGYFINTTSGAVTITLPSSPSAGAIVSISDYAKTSATNNITIGRGGSKISGLCSDHKITTSGRAVTLVYVDATKGWIVTESGEQGDVVIPYNVDFLVIAGGGGGALSGGSGGSGAGGYRASYNCEASGGGGSSESAFEAIAGTTYTITVGAGGSVQPGDNGEGIPGSASSIAGANITTISTVGGGGGGSTDSPNPSSGAGLPGGSGGGADCGAGGTGTSNQGYAGGSSNSPGNYGGGGGGAGAAGTSYSSGTTAGPGGAGVVSTITGSPVQRGGGGGGASYNQTPGTGGAGGGGTGGRQSPVSQGGSGTANTGGGAGGKYATAPGNAGGSGVVIVRMLTSNYSGTQTGGTVTTSGSDTIITFNGSGSFVG